MEGFINVQRSGVIADLEKGNAEYSWQGNGDLKKIEVHWMLPDDSVNWRD